MSLAEGIGSPGLGVTSCGKLPDVYRETTWDHLEEQNVLSPALMTHIF